MNINEEIPSEASGTTQESTPVNNSTVDTMESLIEEFSPKEILERGEIVDGTVINIQDNGLVIDLGQKSEGFVPKNEMRSLTNTETVSYTHLPSPRDMRRSRMPSSA